MLKEAMENIVLTHFVTKELQGLRTDKFLATVTGLSRTRICSLLSQGFIYPPSSPDAKVICGQVFKITLPPAEPASPIAEEINLDILYEDSDLIVLNKPAGMVVHPGAGNTHGTLVNALLSHCGSSLSGIGGVQRPGIVHRIDKNTSGVLVIAKNDFTHQALSQQFSSHSIERIYQAFVYGVPPLSGTIQGNIGRSSTNRQKMAVVSSRGKHAITHYRVIKPLFNGKASWIECKLETGRTHQIRVHMTSIKHPLIGDSLYGSIPKGTPEILRLFPRQALHAGLLAFIHPRFNRKISFSAPLPQDMSLLIQASDIY